MDSKILNPTPKAQVDKANFIAKAMEHAGIGRKKAEYLWAAGFRLVIGLEGSSNGR